MNEEYKSIYVAMLLSKFRLRRWGKNLYWITPAARNNNNDHSYFIDKHMNGDLVRKLFNDES